MCYFYFIHTRHTQSQDPITERVVHWGGGCSYGPPLHLRGGVHTSRLSPFNASSPTAAPPPRAGVFTIIVDLVIVVILVRGPKILCFSEVPPSCCGFHQNIWDFGEGSPPNIF